MKITDALIAFFTFVLAVATVFLWLTTSDLVKDSAKAAAQQARDVRASLALSRESADIAAQAARAATLHAQAAVAVERPFVRVLNLFLNEAGRDEAPDKDALYLRLAFEFKNYGRTPAFVKRIGYGFEIADHPTAPAPEYRFSEGFTEEFVVVPDGTRLLGAPGLVAITPADWAAIIGRTAVLWCWGQLQYRDFMNGVTEAGFLGRYYPEVGAVGHIEEQAEFRFTGPEAYTYQRYIEGESQ